MTTTGTDLGLFPKHVYQEGYSQYAGYDALAIPPQLANLAVTPAGSLPCDAGQVGACQGRAGMTGVRLYCSNAYETCRPPDPDKSATHLGISSSAYAVRGVDH